MSAVHFLQNPCEEHGIVMNLSRVARNYRRHLRECEDLLPGLQPAGSGWLMLTELYIAKIEQRKMSVSGVCVSAGVPSTTGLRYLDMLMGAGMAVRIPDENDRRRSWVRLTDAGVQTVEQMLTGFVSAIDSSQTGTR